MAKIVGDAQLNILELAKVLGVSAKMAATFICCSHVVFSEEKKLKFLGYMTFTKASVKRQLAELLRLRHNNFFKFAGSSWERANS